MSNHPPFRFPVAGLTGYADLSLFAVPHLPSASITQGRPMFTNPGEILNGLASSEVQLRLAAAAAARMAMPFNLGGLFNMPGILPPSKLSSFLLYVVTNMMAVCDNIVISYIESARIHLGNFDCPKRQSYNNFFTDVL